MVSEEEREDIGAAYYEDGREAGLKEGIILTARKMLAAGIPMDQVLEITGLKAEELS